MNTLLHLHGLGDLLMFEKFWTDEEKSSLHTAYWCDRAARLSAELMLACPTYRDVEHAIIASEAEVPDSLRPHASSPWFTRIHHRPFVGSAFLREPLADIDALRLPDRFILIQPTTPLNLPGQRRIRDFQSADWDHVIYDLARRNLQGVIVNGPGGGEVPRLPRILDLSGKTTPAASVEILKRAEGYWGIDSWLAILAAEVFPAEALKIRTRNPWVIRDAHAVYAPHARCPFLYATLGANPHPVSARWVAGPGQTYVELLSEATIDLRTYFPGDIVPLDRSLASRYVSDGRARPYAA